MRVAVLLSDSSVVVSIVGEVEEAESAVLSQSLAVEEESDGEQETAAEGEESERVGSGALGEIRECHETSWVVRVHICRISERRNQRRRS